MSNPPVERHVVEAPDLPLAERLKSATAELHRRAERSAFMSALLSGHLSRERYLALLHNLHALYGELEAQLRAWPASPFRVLDRGAAIEFDLAQLDPARGTRPRGRLTVAMAGYIERLHAQAGGAPHRLAAHAYVRYLGDLHGGQVLRGCVRRLFALPDDRGLGFYCFGDEAATADLRADFRRRLASMTLSGPQADEVVAEARWAYEAHARLFDELLSPS